MLLEGVRGARAAVLILAAAGIAKASAAPALTAAIAGPVPSQSPFAPTPAPATGLTPVARSGFRPGEQAAFRLSVSAASPDAPGVVDSFQATLSLEVVEQEPSGEWLLRAALSDATLRQSLSRPEHRVSQPLHATFMVRVGDDLRLAAEGFPADWAPATRQFVATLLHGFELPVAPSMPAARWQAEQEDGLGRYAARYEATDLPDGGLRVTRTKTHYHVDEQAKDLGISVQLLGATAEATLSAGSRWPTRVSGRERVRIRAWDSVLADLEQRIELRRDDARFVRPASHVLANTVDWQDPFRMPVPASAPALDPEAAALPMDELLARVADACLRSHGRDEFAAARLLGGWLRALPERADDVLAGIRSGEIPESLRPATFLALELVGTQEARGVLLRALADVSLPDIDRARAASALSDVPEPTPRVACALLEAGSDPRRLVAGSSLRALGHLAGRPGKLEPDLQEAIRGELRLALQKAATDSHAIDAIDAMGNCGADDLVGPLAGRLAEGTPVVRDHAARALSHLSPEVGGPPLVARLEVETEADVLAALADSLGQLEVREPEALELAAERLAGRPEPKVRAPLISWLGAVADVPAARAALVAHFHAELDVRLQQLIGRYVSAEELSAARPKGAAAQGRTEAPGDR